MSKKSLLDEAVQVSLARELIELGARLPVLESEITLSRERLLRLYREIQGKSPPRGMLPFSTDWFVSWQANNHASLFMNIYLHQRQHLHLSFVEVMIKSYRLYREELLKLESPEVLSMTRAWRLLKFIDAGMLSMTKCKRCRGLFVTHQFELVGQYVCGLCNVPSRAGKTKATLIPKE